MARLISDIRTLVVGSRKVKIKDGTGQISIGGKVATAQFSGQEVAGFTEQAAPGELSCTLALEEGEDPDDLVVRDTDIRIQAFPAAAPVPAVPSLILTVTDNISR